MNILNLLKSRFADALQGITDEAAAFAEMVKPVQDPRFGDYQANFAMPLGKKIGANPKETAQRVVDKLVITDVCHPPEVAGPGFINLKVLNAWLEAQVNAAADDDRLGVPLIAQPKTVVVDFSSPNVAKPMHVGHLRSTVIGDAIARVQRFLGNKVIADNHIGDWGTQFGMIIYGYKHFVDEQAYARDAVGELARLYRLVNRLCDYHDAQAELAPAQQEIATAKTELEQLEKSADSADKAAQKTLKKIRTDLATKQAALKSLQQKIEAIDTDAPLKALADAHPGISRQAREETAQLHRGNAENRRLWNEFLPACLQALQRVYDRLQIHFDLALGESYYDPMLPEVVSDLEQKQLAKISDGAMCVFIPGNSAPFIVRKADGAFTYATTDLATIRYRVDQLHADEILYVVDARQSEHFKLLMATARSWGFDKVGLKHVSFGTVMGQDGRPYKTRSGDTVGLESLLDDAVAKAREIVAANDDGKHDAEGNPKPELSQEQRTEIAEMVGIGGVKYADLMHNRESDYIFDADKMLAMTGNTATYLQYAYARIQGIFRRGGVDPTLLRAQQSKIVLRESTERALALQVCRYAETLDALIQDSRPNLLTAYLYDLAGCLTAFYDQCPVLKAESEEIRASRLRLCDLVGRIMQHGLSLLGISAPQQM
ncbi:arginine--tRNA ligase [Planctomicrobium piriforme]|uniref:Arginine--tRNA ligase n=1 Tax=Planctomicrobium piriforme TaxID=1576369 RepID=A0A1I3ID76_9PLAN|nr:arginine--tRNA ligase [Planctomicrobium piriforme]SFI45787.1 arginyl-tRNA synthetase [Planctomicrobium piriforme]